MCSLGTGLLLGNGINNQIGIKDLDSDSIYDRFLSLFEVERGIFENLFKGRFDYQYCLYLLESSSKRGIESLASLVYESITGKDKDNWSVNDEDRLQDIITCLALNAIFFDKDGKIPHDYLTERLPEISRYDSVFTLNYFEFWDKNAICRHLHGFFNLNAIDDRTKYILSSQRKMLDEYTSAVEALSVGAEYINLNKIVFAPEGVKKDKLISVAGIFPSDKTFPANDLFPIQPRQLYEELNDVSIIEIFGVSPHGDDSLIEAINKMQYVKVYVHDLVNNEEGANWDNYLTTKHDIVDSSEIFNEHE